MLAGPQSRSRTLAELDRTVLFATLAFLSVILASTLVLHIFVEKHHTLGDALLHTLSIMSVGGKLHEDEMPDNEAMKFFVGLLRISGAGAHGCLHGHCHQLSAACPAWCAFEASRIPDSGHFIVCGLSPIGFRVVEELIAGGEQVVVIEVDPTNRFVATVRRLRKVVVIIGDATVAQVLDQCGPPSAGGDRGNYPGSDESGDFATGA